MYFFNTLQNKLYFLVILFLMNCQLINVNAAEQFSLNENPPLFLMENPKTGKKIYLLGTVHTAIFKEALGDHISRLLQETVFDQVMIEHELKNIAYDFLNKNPDHKIDEELKKTDQWHILTSRLQSLKSKGIKLFLTSDNEVDFDFGKLCNEPFWLINLILSVDLNLRIMNKFNTGMEKYIINSLSKDRNILSYLETPDEIYSIMSKYHGQDHEYMDNNLAVSDTISSSLVKRKFDPYFKTHTNLKNYNITGLLSHSSHPESVIQRNLLWLEKIKVQMEKHNTVLIAVGFGHLTGSHGLLKLMHDQGFNQIKIFDKATGKENSLDSRTLKFIIGRS